MSCDAAEFTYVEAAGSAVLRPWVRSLWYCKNKRPTFARERVLPNGCIQIVINLERDYLSGCSPDPTRLPPAIVVGARGSYETIDTEDLHELVGFVVRPGGFPRLFRERGDLFFERSIALDSVWRCPLLLEQLQEAGDPQSKLAVLDFALRMQLRRSGCVSEGSHGLVAAAINHFGKQQSSIADCASSLGYSERYVSQVFREEAGLSPKLWCRIQRFQAALGSLRKTGDLPWAELALQCGYYDQAHFANDFRAFSGINPRTYSRLNTRWQNHIPVL